MRVAEALARIRLLPTKPFEAAFGQGQIMVLAPHPDDESLGCGGLIAEACRRGRPPVVVILTDGSKSHPNSPSFPAERLRALREDETRAAMCELGLPSGRLVFLRYPDSEAPREGAGLQVAADHVARLIADRNCSIVAVSWKHDPHCDHLAAAAVAEVACRLTGAKLLAYPVWSWTLSPDSQIDEMDIAGFRLDVARHLPAKRAAIEAHRSQYAGIITDDPEGFQMRPDFIDMFLEPTEYYIDVDVSR
jgi:LmbE family N-acetylglucosaminyl deacetylase